MANKMLTQHGGGIIFVTAHHGIYFPTINQGLFKYCPFVGHLKDGLNRSCSLGTEFSSRDNVGAPKINKDKVDYLNVTAKLIVC